QVGVNAGVSTLELCRAIQDRHPGLPLVTGGGVRDAGDLELLANAGIAEVLVASALHDGRLTRADLERWRR
ncbi:MAG: HisA/HisF-related TIM barrel protein, partial [Planctomycetales bacterium]